MSAPPPPPGYGAQPAYGAPGAPPGYPPKGAPPPYGFQGQQQFAGGYVAAMRFGEAPVAMTCPFCGASIVTTTQTSAGTLTWVAVGAICAIGAAFSGLLWFGCCLIPCCVDACKDVNHMCPNCNRPVGKYDRLKNM